MDGQNLYIWQKSDWPAFRWNKEKLEPQLYEVSRKLSYFLGRISMLGENIRESASTEVLEDEIIASNSIEGIMLERNSVRSSIMNRLGLEDEGLRKADHYTEGAVSIVMDAVKGCREPLTKERLFGWHSMLFPSGMSDGRRIVTGRWRLGAMYVISGRMGKETIHYEAPPADMIDKEMDEFLRFVNEEDGVNPIGKAAVAHFWFVSIHPFPDGNGRIARTISEMLLAAADGSDHRYYSLSTEIMNTRKEYYEILEYCQKSTMDITRFIEYFLRALDNAVTRAEDGIAKAIAGARFWDSLAMIPLSERETKLIRMLHDGFKGKLTAEKWARIAKCSHSTALRDINDLISKGILTEDGGNSRNTGYMLKTDSTRPTP